MGRRGPESNRRGFWERKVVPHLIRVACGQSSIERQRAKVVPQARGRVLEVGIGSGLNLRHYNESAVTAVTGVDPSAELTRDAHQLASGLDFELTIHNVSAESIPAQDAAFDSVVVTYALCSIPDVSAALRELHRVLAPGGALLFVEHGLAPDPSVQRAQRLVNPLWRRVGGGCNLHRPIPQLIEGAGFVIEDLETLYLPGIRWLNYNYWGLARRPH